MPSKPPTMGSFAMEIPDDPEDRVLFRKAVEELHKSYDEQTREIQEEYQIPYLWAANIWYLRTRSRWTRALEDELVRMALSGHPQINMNCWPKEIEYRNE